MHSRNKQLHDHQDYIEQKIEEESQEHYKDFANYETDQLKRALTVFIYAYKALYRARRLGQFQTC